MKIKEQLFREIHRSYPESQGSYIGLQFGVDTDLICSGSPITVLQKSSLADQPSFIEYTN